VNASNQAIAFHQAAVGQAVGVTPSWRWSSQHVERRKPTLQGGACNDCPTIRPGINTYVR